MIAITIPLGAVGLLSLAHLSVLFANFSRRLSVVTKMAAHYRWAYLAAGLFTLAALSQMVRGIATLAPQQALPVLLTPGFALVTFHIPIALGVTIDLAVVWYYWRWILRESVD